jgi:hypothetical protein
MKKVKTACWKMLGVSGLFLLVCSNAIAQNKVVVIPLDSPSSASMDIQVIRNANANSHLCGTLSLEASCPTGYKVIGGSIDCGRDGITFSDHFRSVIYSSKSWGVERWTGSCVDLSSPTTNCSPAFVEAICIKLN